MSSSSENKNWAATATLMTLSVSMRCVRDFRYYRTDKPVTIKRSDLEQVGEQLLENSFTLHNLLMDTISPSTWPFLFLIGRSVHDDLETLHRDLLFFDPGDIVDMIRTIDGERTRWKKYNRVSFYSEVLADCLDHEIPLTFQNLLSNLKKLPKES